MSEEEKKNATDAAAVPSEMPKSEVDKKPESGASKKEGSSSKDKGGDRPEGAVLKVVVDGMVGMEINVVSDMNCRQMWIIFPRFR